MMGSKWYDKEEKEELGAVVPLKWLM
jgi:hypothetical protein